MRFLDQASVERVMEEIPNGQFFTIVFLKKNGEVREMACQKGVKKHVKGTGPARKPTPGLQGVYEQKSGGYRCFRTSHVLYIKARGFVYKVAGSPALKAIGR